MKVRHPPGRAGRPWLLHRLQVAERGAELLDDKQRALLRERQDLAPRLVAARERWERLAGEAERWLTRAAVLGGERPIATAAAAQQASPARVEVTWQTLLGVARPVRIDVEHAAAVATAPGGAALVEARRAHREALAAAAELAHLDRALALVDAELRATARRRNAIRHRWIPAHERALAALEAALEEVEREDGARVRSIVRRQGR